MSDLVGTTIGPYQITERLGRGGMADVYKAFHRELSVYRAIKFIRPEFVTSDDFRARFQQEAQGVARLRHPNIIQIHDFGVSDGCFYMVMEYLEGRTLKDLLRTTGRMTSSAAVTIVKGVAAALDYAHARDLIHRDIKPDNIMLDDDGRPVLMDFGIAKLITASTQLTQTGVGIGTPAYMAPEQARGELVSPATDIYALSIVLFELLTGRVPYSADTPMAIMLKALSDPLPMPRTLNPDISEALQGVILKGTAKAPENRYRSAAEFMAALDDATAGGVPNETPANALPPTGGNKSTVALEQSQRFGYVNWMVAILVGIIAVAGAWLWTSRSQDTTLNKSQAGPVSIDNPPNAANTPTTENSPPDRSLESMPISPANADRSGYEPVLWTSDSSIAPGQAFDTPLQFTVGEVLYLKVFLNTADAEIVLSTPDDLAEVLRAKADSGPVTVKYEGIHHLRLAGSQAGHLKATLFRLQEPQLHAGSVYPNDVFANTTDLPGQVLHRYLDLPQNAVIRFNLIRSAAPTDFILVAPDERTLVFSTRASTGIIRAPVSGVYSFYADPENSALADFEASFEMESAAATN